MIDIFYLVCNYNMLDLLNKHMYGFSDTFFKLCGKYVILYGNRYDICNKRIFNFIPFICSIANIPLSTFDKIQQKTDLTEYYQFLEQKSKTNTDTDLVTFLKKNSIEYTHSGEELLSHSHGQLGADEVWRIHSGDYKKIQCVDLVVYPTTTDQLNRLYKRIQLMSDNQKKLKLIPFGGGTNVTGCLMIHKESETDYYISIDMRKYNQILQVNTENNYAVIQSGACGKEIEKCLNAKGYTMGHEPDSYEFSTLGGWISTNASGMRRNMYGNIEEIVIDFGYINKYSKEVDLRFPVRHSHGPNPNLLFYGHEGNFGIITEVLVHIKKLPENKYFNSILFYNMTDGISFLKDVYDANLRPSSIRLVDNEQFKFGQALKPEKTSFFEKLIDKIKKFYLLNILGFDVDKMVACTLMIEGTPASNKFTFNQIKQIASKYKAVFGGSENGRAGYNLTHSIAYIRDFTLDYRMMGETFETSIEWSKIELMGESVKQTLRDISNKYIKTSPFLSYRVSQCYNTGVCVYFTFGFYNDVENSTERGIELYHEMEKCMRETMTKLGGSISHHHGVGQIKADELLDVTDKLQLELHQRIKDTFDTNDIFCNNNYLQ